MKILHAEYGGLVIYNMRLESGTFRLSDIDREESSASLSVNWSELTLIVHGISPSEAKRASRWTPKNSSFTVKKYAQNLLHIRYFSYLYSTKRIQKMAEDPNLNMALEAVLRDRDDLYRRLMRAERKLKEMSDLQE